MPNVKKLQHLDQRLERTESQLQVLQKISRLMARKLSLPEVLQAIVDVVMGATEADACLIYLHEGDDLVLCASNTPHPAQIGKLRLKMGEGITGWVARERRMVAIGQQAYKDPRFRFFQDLPEDTFEAFLSVPVISREEVVGVINVQHRQPRRHLGGEMEMLLTVGEQVGCIIVLARIGELADSLMSPVEALLSSPPIPLGKKPV
ncbi:MAG: GAF domain-containing protein [Acidobacteria bacterium]|nr:GAF domain-containing protein [Acidobacteriota bacterium]